MSKILMTETYEVKNGVATIYFLLKNTYEYQSTEYRSLSCDNCTIQNVLHYVVDVDGINYYIPDTVCMEDPESPLVDATSPVDAFYNQFDRPWPNEEPIHDYQQAYKDFLGIDVEADPFIVRGNDRNTTISPGDEQN